LNRQELRTLFSVTGTAVFPVIHVLDHDQTAVNIDIAMTHDCPGVFLINHDFGVEDFIPIVRSIRKQYPEVWLGLNFLAVTGKQAFPVLGALSQEGCDIDGYWADDARIDERRELLEQSEARETIEVRDKSGWKGLYLGGTAFKKQRPVKQCDYLRSAQIACQWMDVVMTSGVATGEEAGTDKVGIFREGVGECALGLASGITPDNIDNYASDLDVILVATGINYADDFYNIDPDRLKKLMLKLNSLGN